MVGVQNKLWPVSLVAVHVTSHAGYEMSHASTRPVRYISRNKIVQLDTTISISVSSTN